MSSITLYHGSPQKVECPSLDKGNPHNDYGRGFYCTPDLELAREWACKRRQNGFANRFRLRVGGLRTLDLLDGTYTALHWIALLLKNREFSLSGDYAIATRELILGRFLIDLGLYDVGMGYRADGMRNVFPPLLEPRQFGSPRLPRVCQREQAAARRPGRNRHPAHGGGRFRCPHTANISSVTRRNTWAMRSITP